MAGYSYPINPPKDPNPPTANPNPTNPQGGNPPTQNDANICAQLKQANVNTTVQCDNVHFGAPKCQIDWIYAHNAPCGFSNGANYRNGIGYAGTFFQSFDQKGFFRIEGTMDAKAGQANLYSYAGSSQAFEIYMYKDGLNIKGLQSTNNGQPGGETCHIKIFKSDQQTEIDFQGATNLSFEGAEIFKSQLYKQTIEGFVSKYDYNQEWVGLEANVSKSFAWGGLDQSNYYRLMYDNASSRRGFLEILTNGYDTYLQLQVKSDKVNLYSQLNGTNTYFGIEATNNKTEEVLYYNNSIVKLKSDQNEASTYNTYNTNMYASLVSKNDEGYVYLKGNGNGYSFLENKLGEARLWGSADGGQDYFDIRTQGGTYLQVNNDQDRFYLAPKDIPKNSDPEKHYASFNYFYYIDDTNTVKKEAIVSSDFIDIRHLGTCWAKYPCKPTPSSTCIDTLTFGGSSNITCKLTAFDVYCGNGNEFEMYQYQYGIDFKPVQNKNNKVAIYTDGSSSMNLDVAATTTSMLSVRDAQATRYSQVFADPSTNGFKLNRGYSISYMSADNSYRYLILSNPYGANWRTAAGTTSADTTIYTNGGNKQVGMGASSSQAYMQFYSNNGTNQMFGYAGTAVVQWEGTMYGAYAQMKIDGAEGKFQTSKGGAYAYMVSDLNSSELSLVTSSRATINASAGSANWSVTLANGDTNAYWQGTKGQVSINTDDCKNKYVSLREIDVCIDGEKKKMIILASDPY
jgi:hypothetical protein